MRTPESLVVALNRQLDDLVAGGAIFSAAIDVRVPDRGWHISLSSGEARPGLAMATEQPVHWASIGKTLTAVLVMQALEQGLLGDEGLDTRLAMLGVFPPDLLASLHPRSDEITLDHLLRHISGLRDGMVDTATTLAVDSDGPAPGSLMAELLRGPESPACQHWRPWDPSRPFEALAGTLNFFLAGNVGSAPVGAPGERFHYSDTGYVILALVCEKLLGQPLQQLCRERIFQPLGIDDAYLAYRDDPELESMRAPEADVYAGEVPLLASGFDLSFDWGGGGQVSSVASLNRILIGLNRCELASAESLDAMRAWRAPPGLKEPRLGVGRGLFRTNSLGGELWGHSGAWGAKMFYQPEADIYFSGTVNQVFASADWHWPLLETVREALK